MFMTRLRNFIEVLSGKRNQTNKLQIVFQTKTAILQGGAHGLLIADYPDQNIKDRSIRFVFLGISTPPELTPAVMTHIWEEATLQGFIPKELRSYGTVVRPQENSTAMTSAKQSIVADNMPARTRVIADADARASLKSSTATAT
jgi:hypothetical protein